MVSNEQKATVLEAVNKASEQWKTAFNSGDAAGCAAQYEENAVMQAKPFWKFTGLEAIQAFWQKLIDDGYSDVEYVDPQVTVLDANSAIITSGWKMNNAKGVIHKELWVLQDDGTAKLREDDFEAMS